VRWIVYSSRTSGNECAGIFPSRRGSLKAWIIPNRSQGDCPLCGTTLLVPFKYQQGDGLPGQFESHRGPVVFKSHHLRCAEQSQLPRLFQLRVLFRRWLRRRFSPDFVISPTWRIRAVKRRKCLQINERVSRVFTTKSCHREVWER